MLFKMYFTAVVYLMLVSSFRNVQSNAISVKRPEFEKLPTYRHLAEYLKALNRLVDFTIEHEKDIDINYFFGLFLANVNLKRALRERVLPKKVHNYIEEIILKTDNLLKCFKFRIVKDDYLRNNKYKAIFSLFVNTTTFINNLPNLHGSLRNIKPQTDSKKEYLKWILYRRSVDDRNAWIPTPRQSDLCLASLASAEVIKVGSSKTCKVKKLCYEMVKNGTDFGYALAHRLLFLQQARFSRGCSIFSEQEDKQMRQRFCTAAYFEAEYIALHEFEIVDLLLEHVCLCALDGNAQFLKRSWLTKILSFQTSYGCFSQTYNSNESPRCLPRKAIKFNNCDVERCNGHTTAVAAGALALASRFILHFYY